MQHTGHVNILPIFGFAVLLAGSARAAGPDEPFDVEEAFFALEQDIVTATRTPTPLVEAPAVVSVITRAEIRRHAWRSVAEALTSVPGLFGYYDGVNWAFGTRGNMGGIRANSRLLKVLLNGQPVAYRYDTTNWLGRQLVPIGLVERIEVIRGPASALYGADAFLGVVNIITRETDALGTGWVAAEAGVEDTGMNRVGGEVASGVRFGPLHAMLGFYIGMDDRSGLEIPESSPAPRAHGDETRSEGDLARPVSLMMRSGLALGEDHQLQLDAQLMVLDVHGELTDYSVLSHGNRIAMANGFVRFGYEGTVAPGHRLRACAAWAAGGTLDRERLDTGSTLNAFRRDEGYHALDLGLDWRWSAASWLTVTAGVDQSTVLYDLTSYYKILKVDTPAAAAGEVLPHAEQGSETLANVGVFAQAVIKPLDFLLLTAGGRFDYHEVYEEQWNGRAALVLRPVPRLTLKILAGSSFKAPSPLHLYAPSPPIVPGDIVGNPDLEEEEASTYEVALVARLFDGLSVSVAGYHSLVHGKVEFAQIGEARKARNNTSVTSWGLEADVRFQWRGLNLYGFLAWDRSRREPLPDEDPLFGEEVSEYPAWTGGGGIGYHIAPAHLRLQSSVRWAGERRASQSNLRLAGEDYRLPAYAVVDLVLSTADLSLFGKGETRFSFRISDVGDAAPVQPGFGGVDIPSRGRFYQFTLSQEL